MNKLFFFLILLISIKGIAQSSGETERINQNLTNLFDLAEKNVKSKNTSEALASLKNANVLYYQQVDTFPFVGRKFEIWAKYYQLLNQPTITYQYYRIASNYFFQLKDYSKCFWLRLDMVNQLIPAGKVNEAIVEYTSLKEELKQYNFDKKIKLEGTILLNLGVCYKKIGETNKALQTYKNSIPYDVDKAAIFYNISNIYSAINQYDSAFAYAFRVSQVKKVRGDSIGFGQVYLMIGINLLHLEQIEESKSYFNQAIQVLQKEKDYTSLARVYFSYTELYLKEHNDKKAEESWQKMIELKEYDKTNTFSQPYLKARILYERQLYNDAKNEILKAIDYNQNTSDQGKIADAKVMLTEILIIQKKHKEAIENANWVLKFGTDSKRINFVNKANYLLSKIYNSKGDFEKANELLEKQFMLNDTFEDKQLKGLELYTQIQEKEKVNNTLNDLVTEQKELKYLTLFLVISSILFFAFYIYRRYKTKEEIKKYRVNINYVIEQLKINNYSITHDLRTPLVNAEHYIQLAEYNIDKLPKDELFKIYLEPVKTLLQRMNDMIDKIMYCNTINNKNLEYENINMNALLSNVIDEVRINYSNHKATITITDLPNLNADKTLIYQLFLNLISNAFKFSSKVAEPKIFIEYSISEDHQHLFTIKDNGIGLDDSYQDKVFQLFHTQHNREEFEGYGIGLSICKNVVERHRGSIWVKSTPYENTSFFVTLPK